MVKTNELQKVSSVVGTDCLLADTDLEGTARVPMSVAAEYLKSALATAMQTTAADQVKAAATLETGTVSPSNSQSYPFTSSEVTVALKTARKNLNYVVDVEVSASTGNVQSVQVYDKQLNGFKIKYDGSATSATIKYIVSGGMTA